MTFKFYLNISVYHTCIYLYMIVYACICYCIHLYKHIYSSYYIWIYLYNQPCIYPPLSIWETLTVYIQLHMCVYMYTFCSIYYIHIYITYHIYMVYYSIHRYLDIFNNIIILILLLMTNVSCWSVCNYMVMVLSMSTLYEYCLCLFVPTMCQGSRTVPDKY